MLHSDAFYYFSKLEANYPKKVKVKEGYQIGFRTLFFVILRAIWVRNFWADVEKSREE